jgi:hypothetical protein
VLGGWVAIPNSEFGPLPSLILMSFLLQMGEEH